MLRWRALRGLLDQRALREATANFRRLDTNGDGELQFTEFEAGATALLHDLPVWPVCSEYTFNSFNKRPLPISQAIALTTELFCSHLDIIESNKFFVIIVPIS